MLADHSLRRRARGTPGRGGPGRRCSRPFLWGHCRDAQGVGYGGGGGRARGGGGGCTSDVVTTRDAAAGLALAAAGAMTLLSLPWPGEEQRGFWLLTLGSLSIAALSALLIGNPLYALGAPIVLLGALLVGVPRAIKGGVQEP